ncbi:toprim domain-containing protein [Neisseria sp. WLZKY-1]|uniref:DUF7146 domain-containing protein n=1 Tax=Neisseria sp. WLZKY-1 TaxID=3390377 RepID=UPI003979BBC6
MKPFDLSDLKAAAQGRWPAIHAALGIPQELLNTRKHQPCPNCGGRNRYRYTNHQESGGYICNQCGSGSGFDLIMLVFGYSFTESVNQVSALLGMARPSENRPAPRIAPAAAPKAERDKLPELAALFDAAAPLADSPAALYLKGRGLSDGLFMQCADLRCHPALPYWTQRGGKPERIGSFPALLAAVRTPDGTLQGLHKTYLQADGRGGFCKFAGIHPDTGEALPAKKMATRYAGAFTGAAVHLGSPDAQGRIIAAEGIETALAAWQLFGIPAIAALSAHGLQSLQWPSETQTLLIAADNDHSQTGKKAAEALTRRAARAGIGGGVWQPENPESDALDVWNERNKA